MMNTIKLINICTEEEIKNSFHVLKELRNNLDFENYLMLYKEANRNGYKMVGLECEGVICALMGYRILVDFVHGKHLYIDDLVSTKSQRSKGMGAQLLQHAESLAKEHQCQGLRLCTGIENELGKKFYERHGWKLRAVAYKKKFE